MLVTALSNEFGAAFARKNADEHFKEHSWSVMLKERLAAHCGGPVPEGLVPLVAPGWRCCRQPQDRQRTALRAVDSTASRRRERLAAVPFGTLAEATQRACADAPVGTLLAADREFEERVGALQAAPGAKAQMVVDAVERLPDRFQIGDVRRVCPGVSDATITRILRELRDRGQITSTGRGQAAAWRKVG